MIPLVKITPTTLNGAQSVYRCSRCDFEDKCKSAVVHHFRTHASGAAFMCCLCGDKSDYRNSIYRHIRNKHRRADYNSIIIEAAIRQPGAALRTGDEPTGVNLNAVVLLLPVVPAAVPAAVPVEEDDSSTGGGGGCVKPLMLKMTTKLYRCGVCDYASCDKSVLDEHKFTEHSISEPSRYALCKRNAPMAKPSHFCEICPYKTNNRSLFALHMTRHYPQVRTCMRYSRDQNYMY